uniref:Uncharacterized protein n=1 Tax=Aegilops tauschii subsp. strangulata TaxID=200361 RepID=A0A453REF2_AEGTS
MKDLLLEHQCCQHLIFIGLVVSKKLVFSVQLDYIGMISFMGFYHLCH